MNDETDFVLVLKCAFCSTQIEPAEPNEYTKKLCPECKRMALQAISPYHTNGLFNVDKFSESVREKYQFISLNPTGEIFYYDAKEGIWFNHGDQLIQQDLANRLRSLNKKSYFGESLNHLQGRTRVQESPFDRLDYIPFANAVLNPETMDLLPYDSAYRLTRKLPIAFNKDAQLPNKILKFVYEIADGNFETFVTLLEGMAYSFFVNSYSIQIIFVLHGEGANGKSKFLTLLTRLVDKEGEHKNSANLTFEQLCIRQFAVAKIKGKLLNIAADIPSRPINDIAMLKELSGGDRIEADVKHSQDGINFLNVAKLWFSANTYPRISEDTRAVYRRFQVIEFRRVFSQGRDVIPEITTTEELEGLVNLLIRVFFPVIQKKGKLTFQKDYLENRDLYLKASDSVKHFIENNIVSDTGADIPKTTIYDAYTQYCISNKISPYEDNAFWRRAREILTYSREHMKEGIRYVAGLKIQKLESEGSVAAPLKFETKKFGERLDDYVKNNQDVLLETHNKIEKQDIQDIQDIPICKFLNQSINTITQSQNNPNIPNIPISNHLNPRKLLENGVKSTGFEDVATAKALFNETGAQNGLFLGHNFEHAPAKLRDTLYKMNQEGEIYEFKHGHWKAVERKEEVYPE